MGIRISANASYVPGCKWKGERGRPRVRLLTGKRGSMPAQPAACPIIACREMDGEAVRWKQVQHWALAVQIPAFLGKEKG